MTNEAEFEKHWLNAGTDAGLGVEDAIPDIKAIKEYAYWAFDNLDKNGNGFLERDELLAALESGITPREKSFITFLLNNQENIAEMVQEAGGGPSDGISREDLESYFALIGSLLD